MVLRSFKITLGLYTEFKSKVKGIELTGGKTLSVGQVIRALIRLYLNNEITNKDIIYNIYTSEAK